MQRSVEREFMLPACARYGAWASARGIWALSLPPLYSRFIIWIGYFVFGVFVGKGTAF